MPTLRRPRAFLDGRTIGEIGSMAFARVDDQEPVRARAAREHALGRPHRAVEERDVIAERLAEAAGFDEVALEVDHEERGRPRVELERVGFRLDAWHDHSPWSRPRSRRLRVAPSPREGEGRSRADKGPSASLAPSIVRSTYRKYASRAIFWRRLAAGPFSPREPSSLREVAARARLEVPWRGSRAALAVPSLAGRSHGSSRNEVRHLPRPVPSRGREPDARPGAETWS